MVLHSNVFAVVVVVVTDVVAVIADVVGVVDVAVTVLWKTRICHLLALIIPILICFDTSHCIINTIMLENLVVEPSDSITCRTWLFEFTKKTHVEWWSDGCCRRKFSTKQM
jgi:hypothetical protein